MTTETAKPPRTHVIMVVDESGSMAPLVEDVRGGFNTFVEGLHADKGARFRLHVTMFANDIRLLCAGAKPKDVPKLDRSNYSPRGLTALYYAIGRAITGFEQMHPTLKEGEKVMLVVQTDGQENYSHQHPLPGSESDEQWFDREKVRAMIAEREARGWTCLFLAEGPDAWGADTGFTHRVETHAVGDVKARTYGALSHTASGIARGMQANTAADYMEAEVGRDRSGDA